jgi:hypothetical protein
MKKGNNNKAADTTEKKESNAGSGAFNQGAEQESINTGGIKVSDEEKRTGHTPFPRRKKKNENLKDSNTGTNNAGGDI